MEATFRECARQLTTSYDLGRFKRPDEVGLDPREFILPRPGFRTVLGNRDFRLIWSAQVASQLADKFLMFALLILTYSISHASTHGAALFLAYTFPSVFLSPFAGVYADRHDKKRLMFFTNAIRGGLILLIPLSQVIPYFEHVTWHLFVIIFLFAAVGQIFAPAEAAAIPFIVGTEELMTATSMFTSTVIGMLAAAFYLGQYGRHFRRSRLLIGGLVSAGVTLMLMASVPYLLEQLNAGWLLVSFPVVFGFIGGLEFGMLFIPAFTVLQEKTEAELRGRIFGAMFTVVNAAVAIPILLAGGLADLFGVTWVIFGMGCLLAASGAISAVAGRRSPLA